MARRPADGRWSRTRPADRSQRLACPSRRGRTFRPLIVGEAPSRTSDPARPLSGACGDRLAALAGLPPAAFRRRFALANLLDAWPGADGPKGARFDRAAAAVAARLLGRRQSALLVLLGHRVGAAFGVSGSYFSVARVPALAIVVPHPSGINRWYNAPANVILMAALMRALSSEAKMTKEELVERLTAIQRDTVAPGTASAIGEIVATLRSDLDVRGARKQRKAEKKKGAAASEEAADD